MQSMVAPASDLTPSEGVTAAMTRYPNNICGLIDHIRGLSRTEAVAAPSSRVDEPGEEWGGAGPRHWLMSMPWSTSVKQMTEAPIVTRAYPVSYTHLRAHET